MLELRLAPCIGIRVSSNVCDDFFLDFCGFLARTLSSLELNVDFYPLIFISEHINVTKRFVPAQDPVVDFTLSNARRFYSSMGDPLGSKGLINLPYLFLFLIH